jgi:hypothetical protein
VGLLALALPAHAYRPFNGTDADVAEYHEWELEIGPLGYLRVGAKNFLVAPALIVNYGVAHGYELVLEGRNHWSLDGGARLNITDTALSLKHVLRAGILQGGTGPSVATEWSLVLPTSDEHRPGAEVSLIVSERWTGGTVHWNGAFELTREQDVGFVLGPILEGPIDWRVRPVAEVEIAWATSESWALETLGGALWRVGPQVTVDVAGLYTRHARDATGVADVEIRAGFTWTL